jgi:hypothetical protein
MGVSAGRRHVSLGGVCVFILWFPFDVPTAATGKQLYAGIELWNWTKIGQHLYFFAMENRTAVLSWAEAKCDFSVGRACGRPIPAFIVVYRSAVELFRAGGPDAGPSIPSVVRARGSGRLRTQCR